MYLCWECYYPISSHQLPNKNAFVYYYKTQEDCPAKTVSTPFDLKIGLSLGVFLFVLSQALAVMSLFLTKAVALFLIVQVEINVIEQRASDEKIEIISLHITLRPF